MFGLGFTEIFLLLCIALLLFGPHFFQKHLLSLRDSFLNFQARFHDGRSDERPLGSTRKDHLQALPSQLKSNGKADESK